MPDDDNPLLRDILDRAAELPTHERPAFLDTACADNPALRAEIENLLSHLDTADEFLREPTFPPGSPATHAADTRPNPSNAETTGTKIGRYTLLQLIGEGGFGSVFLAQQEHPVRRTVAIKIIKLGMDTRQVIARFEAERQALAMMDHPNIARVLDAGTTETGRPYFVMELVNGLPITEYCRRARLTPRQRIELLIPVCKAVQHAHQKGIIHRDLKPSNVMITLHDGVPVPKVIDFGIAKAINQKLTEHTLFTEDRQLLGTPEYTSPEQAGLGKSDVDTRSDIYSLGVLLYELLTGTTPFDSKLLRQSNYEEMRRIIRDVEPPRPSTRIGSLGEGLHALAGQMATDPKRLGRVVARELDWIVMKCLEKDRTRRYETAAGLARDLSLYLSGEPVEASPPSASYRLRKLARRHRIPLAVAALFLMSTFVSSWQAFRATQARHAADIQRQRADEQAGVATRARNAAEAARADALQSAAKAAEARRTAELRLAYGLIAEGDAMAQSARWIEAKQRYREAGDSLEKLGESRMPADLGLLNAYQTAPPPLLEFQAHKGKVYQTAFSPDGRLAASAGADGAVCVWDLVNGYCKFRLLGHTQAATCVAFSPDGRFLISGSYDNTVRIWSLADGTCRPSIPCWPVPTAVGFSPRMTWFWATNSLDHSPIWEFSTGREVCRLGLDDREVRFMAFSPDEKTVLLGGVRLQMKLFDPSTGKTLRTIPTSYVTWDARYSSDGRYVLVGIGAVAEAGHQALLFDANTWEIAAMYVGHTSNVTTVAFAPGESHVLAASDDGTVMRWQRGSPVAETVAYGDVRPLGRSAISPDCRLALSAEEDGKIRLWDLGGDHGYRHLQAHSALYSLDISRDGRTAVTASDDGLSIWDIPSRSIVRHIPSVARMWTAISPDGRFALSSDIQCGVYLLDITSGTETALKNPPGMTRTGAFSRDGKWMSWADGSDAYVADVQTRTVRTHIHPRMTMQPTMALSKNDLFLLTATSHGTAYFYLLPWGIQVPLLAWFQDRRDISANVVYTHHQAIAISGRMNRLIAWDTFTGNLIADLEGHRGIITHVALSPDERWVASSARDGTVKLWDMAELREARTLGHEPRALVALAWSEDGRTLLSGADVGTIDVWELDRPAQYRKLLPELRAALNTLATNTVDKPALQTLARWYAFRGHEDWAAEISNRIAPK